MAQDEQQQTETTPDAFNLLTDLCTFTGPPEAFWPLCMEAMSGIAGAGHGLLAVRRTGETPGWRVLCSWPQADHQHPLPKAFLASVDRLADGCLESGSSFERVPGDRQSQRRFMLATRLQTISATDQCVAAFLVAGSGEGVARSSLSSIRAASYLPKIYQLNAAVGQSQVDRQHFAAVLDLMVLLNRESRYLAAAMVLCNELASVHGCERVSLGWLRGGYVRLQAMSHTERFERKMEAVKKLELAMEECLDQDTEIICPRADDTPYITRDHEAFVRDQGVPHICSLPLRLGADTVAALTCERTSGPFTEIDIGHLRLCTDQVVRRLDDLRRRDRWFGARFAARSRELLGKVVGIEHTWVKIATVAVLACVLVLVFAKAPYRVEGSFVVRSKNVSHLPAPFQGYIKSVGVRVGDFVSPDTMLVSLDTRDLLLEESAAESERNRYLREAEKARAENALANMRIAEAQAAQAITRLTLIRYRLSQAGIAAPFPGIIIRGDSADELDERIGAPVERGEVLLKVARLEDMFVEAEVDERDVDDLEDGLAGEIAFASQPHLKFPVQLERIEPIAQARDGRNVFLVLCTFSNEPETWFRPGMSGVCKIDIEERTLLWIFTHRTIDFLRMLLWW